MVRQCKAALDKLFKQNLTIQLSDSSFANLQVQLYVADFKVGQISPSAKIEHALTNSFDHLERFKDDDGILNLTNFSKNRFLWDMVVNLGNRSVLEKICDSIYRNDDRFRTINGILLAQNAIISVAPLAVFRGIDFAVLNLSDNLVRLYLLCI